MAPDSDHSVVVPGLDLAPSLPSRIVTVDLIDMTEGERMAGAKVDFILPQDLHVPADGVILKACTTTLTLDESGHGEIKLPCSSTVARPSDFVIEVKKHWAPYPYPIRVPAGSTKVNLASLNSPVEVSPAMAKHVISAATDVSLTVEEGAVSGGRAEVTPDGVLDIKLTLPPGGIAWQRGAAPTSTDLDALRLETDQGMYRVTAPAIAEALGLPERIAGTVWVEWVRGAIPTTSVARQEFQPETGDSLWQRYSGPDGWSPWVRVDSLPRTLQPGDDANTLIMREHNGFWRVITQADATQISGLPTTRPGQLHCQWIRGTTPANAVALQTMLTEDGDLYRRRKTSAGFSQWVQDSSLDAARLPVTTVSWESLIMGNTTAVNAVAFACDPITTRGDMQYAVWQDPSRNPILSRRTHGETAAAAVNLGALLNNPLAVPTAFDGHNNYVVGVSDDGIVHVAGNMHASPLRYVRTTMPGDITTWTTDGHPTGPDTTAVTYPQFVRVKNELLLIYRSGGSGNGATHIHAWDTSAKTWVARSTPLSGRSEDGVTPDESPYTNYPTVSDDGTLHFFYLWRETSELATTHDICHICSTDAGLTWQSITGEPLSLPVTPTTSPTIISGYVDTMNQSGATVDTEGNPHAAFWIRAGDTTNLTHMWWDGTTWATEVAATSSKTPWALPRPAMIRHQNRVGIIYSTVQDQVDLCDVTTSGLPRLPTRTIISGIPLGGWEPTIDSRALKTRGAIYTIITPIQPNSRSASHTPNPLYTSRQGQITKIDLNDWT